MTGITRSSIFWIAFVMISALGAVFAWRLFPQALPLITLDVKMTRNDALEQARLIAEKYHLAPGDARSAALFAHDGPTQNFVELEAGGKPRFSELLSGAIYAPYWWEVRLFKPKQTAEARLRFKPDGSPYGFALKLPEAEPGAALDAEAARAIAEAGARNDWDIDFTPFKLLEQSQVRRSGGRVDHTFVYERQDERLGDGRFRMNLGVAGDRFNELRHFVHVPEAFERRFQEMRSANNNIARVASLAAGALYGLGGCLLGTLWLLRRHALLWKPALAAGAIVAAISALALLANAPQNWFAFDTAQSTWVFWGQQVGLAVLLLLLGSLLLAVVFMAAEGLTRLAFPDHPQLWRLWSRDAAPTPAVMGRTLGGYLFVPIELALIAGFYFVTNRYFGWWQPSEALTDPNILGSALPALAPIAMALQAGFMEECLFRAIPLSIAALLGVRLGHRRVFIGFALVLQAVIFGAAHANYPGFPSYSRLVELVVPAFIWGLIYLRFGLLSTVILHALFDLTLMSIPVFLVEGSGSLLNEALVVAAGLIPLAIVFWQRARVGRWLEFAPALRNAGWLAAAGLSATAAVATRAAAGVWTQRTLRALPWLGIGGLLAIVLAGNFHADVAPLAIDRAAAEAAADAALKERGVMLSADWRRASATRIAPEEPNSWLWHKFVWRIAGKDTYRKLAGSWLAPALWEVRYARFEGGDVADRAEEWRVAVEGDGKVRQVAHQLPEKRAGARLSREDARTLAQRELRQHFELDPAALREVSVEQQDRPARTDWQFTYTDPRVDAGKGGEARALVAIAGEEITNAGRYVFVPEDWQRAERERAGRLGIAKSAVAVAFIVVGIAALIAAIVAWNRGRFDRRAFWVASGLLLLTGAINAVNQWPLLGMRLSTAEPITPQIALHFAGTLLSATLAALIGGLLSGVASFAARAHVEPELTPRALWVRGVAAALFMLGVEALLSHLAPQSAPLWSSYKSEEAWLPWLARISGSISSSLLLMAATIVALYWLERLTGGWSRRRLLAFVVLALAEGARSALAADQWSDVIVGGLIGGALSTFLFATVLRFDLRVVPPLIAVHVAVYAIADAMQKQTPSAARLAFLATVTAFAVAWAATRYLLRPDRDSAGAQPVPMPAALDVPSDG